MLKTELRSFHAVAKHGGFSAASHVLNLSQPALSTQVKLLEERYDVELFIRAGRKVTLTADGEELYKVTTRLTQIEEEAENLLNSFKGLNSGSLRIAAVGPFHATDMIVSYKSTHPQIDVTVQFGNSKRCIERLLNYESDIGLIAGSIEEERMVTLPFSTHSVVIFVNSDHEFYNRESISLRELQDQKVVQRELGSTTRTAIENALQSGGITTELVLEIGSREGIWKAVEKGVGIGFVADFEFVPHSNLRAIPINDTPVYTQYSLILLKERQHSRLIQSFCNLVKPS